MRPLLTRKRIIIVAGIVLAFGVLSCGGYAVWLTQPPAMPETVEDVESLMVNERYLRMSNAEKRPYQERMNEMWGKLNDEDKKRLKKFLKDNADARQAAGTQFMRDMYTNMILNQSESARNIMLDSFNSKMNSPEAVDKRQEHLAKRDTPEGREREREGKKKMFDWLDKGDPQTTGYMSEVWKLMRNRREELKK